MVADGIMALGCSQEITRNKLSALVNKLIERMLPVGSWLPPKYWPGLIAYRLPRPSDALAVALHIRLLQVIREIGQILIVWEDSAAFRTPEVVVPDAEQPHDHGDIPIQGRSAEVFVHFVCARQHRLETIHSYIERYRESNRRPERIPTPNPIPEDKHVLMVDPKSLNRISVGGDRREVLGHSCIVAGMVQEPAPSCMGIHHSLLGGECLRSDKEDGRLWIKA